MGPSSDESEYASTTTSGSTSSDSNPKGSGDEDGASQTSLSESTDGEIKTTDDEFAVTVDEEIAIANPTQEWLLEALAEQRGEVYAKQHDVIQKCGVVSKDENPSQVDLTETVADPDHELWDNRADLADDRVISQEDALRELEGAYTALKSQGYVVEDENRSPPAMVRLNVVETQ